MAELRTRRSGTVVVRLASSTLTPLPLAVSRAIRRFCSFLFMFLPLLTVPAVLAVPAGLAVLAVSAFPAVPACLVTAEVPVVLTVAAVLAVPVVLTVLTAAVLPVLLVLAVLPAVVLPVWQGPRMLLTRNLIYTAVTRARKCVAMAGGPSYFYEMVNNTQELRRYTGLKDRIRSMYGA